MPVGRYLIDKEIRVPARSQIVGDGFGSVLFQVKGDWKQAPLVSLESDTILRDIQLDQEQPLPENGTWSPDDSFDYIVRAKRGDIIIENIKIFKAYRGIAVGGLGEGVGRVQLRNIRAGAFASGILIDDAMDVVRVEGVHLWPFYADSLNVQKDGTGAPIDNWTKANGIAIASRRNDNGFFSNIFVLGYRVGMLFDTSPTPPQPGDAPYTSKKVKVVSADFDFVGIGIHVTGREVRMLSVQSMSYLGERNSAYHIPVLVEGDLVSASFVNVNAEGASHSAISVPGGACHVLASEWFVKSWNESQTQQAAFKALGSGSQVWVKQSFVNVGSGAPLCNGTLSCDAIPGQNL